MWLQVREPTPSQLKQRRIPGQDIEYSGRKCAKPKAAPDI